MTSVYGVTYVGAREQIKRRLQEKGCITDDRLLFSASCYAAKVTLSALGEMFQAARNIMKWLADCAKTSYATTFRQFVALRKFVQRYMKVCREYARGSLLISLSGDLLAFRLPCLGSLHMFNLLIETKTRAINSKLAASWQWNLMGRTLDHPSVSDGIVRNDGFAIQPPSSPCQNDGFLELNDIVDSVNMNYPFSEESVDCFLRDTTPVDIGELFDSNENTETPATYEMCPFPDDFYLEPKDLDLGDFAYPSDQTGGDNLIFHDASSYDLPPGTDNFIQMNDLFPPIADSIGISDVEDISSYFNNAYNSQYPAMDGSTENISASSAVVESNFPLEVRRTVAIPAQAFEALGTSSLNLPGSSRPNSIKENIAVVPDSQVVESCDRSLTKRLVNMLGSISAPPAYAAEPTSSSKSVGRASAANSASSSIHVTAGMIQIRGFEVTGRAEHWSMHRNGDMGFLLSCGVASRKSDDGSESVPKIRGWSMSVVLRGGLYCFLLSALVLMLCFKVGIRICSR